MLFYFFNIYFVVFFYIFCYNNSMEFEVNLIKFLQTGLNNTWISFFQVITLLGSWLGLLVAFIIIFRKRKLLAFYMVFTFIFASIVNFVIKNIVCRPRPFETYDFIINYGGEGGFSMPSGHSVCVAVLAIFICVYAFQTTKSKSLKSLTTIFSVLFALLVAFSRMVLGVHYLTDVIIGLLEGAIIASIMLLIYMCYFNKLKRKIILNNLTDGEENE